MAISSGPNGHSAAELAARFEHATGRFAQPDASRPAVSVSQPPELSVALASYNRREGLARALDALARQTLAPERFEVIVVLDGSTDGSAEMVRARSDPFELRLVEQENSGLSATRNRGAAAARRDVVVFVDDDILLDSDCLAAYVDAHRGRGPDHVVLGVAWTDVASDLWSGMIRDWWDRHYRLKADPGHRWTFSDVADGMASIPRTLFQETGGFDESFFMFSEEVDLCYRMRAAGWSVVFYPGAEFVHVGGASTRLEWGLMYREQLRGHLRFLAKHEGLERAEQARMLLVAALRLRGVVFRGERGRTYREAGRWLASGDAKALLQSPG